MSMADELILDNQLFFALYVCSKEIIRKYKPYLDPLGLTYTSYITMMALWEKDGVLVKDLGSRLFLDSGTLTPLLKKMEKDGFICRTHSTDDERSIIITLTQKGRELKEKCRDIPKNVACCAKLSKENAEIIRTYLHSIMKCIK